MRIGILTFHGGHNYGGILQCYALQKKLEAAGHQVEIINYIPQAGPLLNRIRNKIKTLNSWKTFVRFICEYLSDLIHRQPTNRVDSSRLACIQAEFDAFRDKHLHLTPAVSYETIGAFVADRYDAIVVGSDQVWTALYTPHDVYFIGWAPEYPGKRFSYAACSAYDHIRKKQSKKLAVLLKQFTFISVRDQVTARLVEQITGKIPPLVPDPTELHSFDEFIANPPQTPYILTYILGSEIAGGHKKALEKIRKKCGTMQVVSIVLPEGKNEITNYADQICDRLSPEEWVNLFAYASYIYTDSFHGIMFAVKFEIPFTAYYSNIVRSSRLIDLKTRYNLANIVTCAEAIEEKNMTAVSLGNDPERSWENFLKVLHTAESPQKTVK